MMTSLKSCNTSNGCKWKIVIFPNKNAVFSRAVESEKSRSRMTNVGRAVCLLDIIVSHVGLVKVNFEPLERISNFDVPLWI